MDKEGLKLTCYQCVHRREVPGSAHSRCNNARAQVSAHAYGVRSGWFTWPFDFDPVWLLNCDGFSNNPADNRPERRYPPLLELAAMLGRR